MELFAYFYRTIDENAACSCHVEMWQQFHPVLQPLRGKRKLIPIGGTGRMAESAESVVRVAIMGVWRIQTEEAGLKGGSPTLLACRRVRARVLWRAAGDSARRQSSILCGGTSPKLAKSWP
ncbi:hypothetical protein HOK021_28480 [Streptomyces hygroscopicus]|nr:hypothetical protein HOK021_28480 [Streptomyces hygroscopicus]